MILPRHKSACWKHEPKNGPTRILAAAVWLKLRRKYFNTGMVKEACKLFQVRAKQLSCVLTGCKHLGGGKKTTEKKEWGTKRGSTINGYSKENKEDQGWQWWWPAPTSSKRKQESCEGQAQLNGTHHCSAQHTWVCETFQTSTSIICHQQPECIIPPRAWKLWNSMSYHSSPSHSLIIIFLQFQCRWHTVGFFNNYTHVTTHSHLPPFPTMLL